MRSTRGASSRITARKHRSPSRRARTLRAGGRTAPSSRTWGCTTEALLFAEAATDVLDADRQGPSLPRSGASGGWKVVRFNHTHPHNRLDRLLLATRIAPSPDGRVLLVWSAMPPF